MHMHDTRATCLESLRFSFNTRSVNGIEKHKNNTHRERFLSYTMIHTNRKTLLYSQVNNHMLWI